MTRKEQLAQKKPVVMKALESVGLSHLMKASLEEVEAYETKEHFWIVGSLNWFKLAERFEHVAAFCFDMCMRNIENNLEYGKVAV